MHDPVISPFHRDCFPESAALPHSPRPKHSPALRTSRHTSTPAKPGTWRVTMSPDPALLRLEVQAFTKSEARAALKKQLNLVTLPDHLVIEEVVPRTRRTQDTAILLGGTH